MDNNTTTQKMNDHINGCYTQLLRRVLNIHWRDHTTNREVYGNLPPLSDIIMQRRLQFAGHCLRTADQPISHLVFWNPPGGHPNRGRRKMSYTDTITRDTNLNPNETQQLMRDKATWHHFIKAASTIPS